jgi:pyruvate kinase
MVARGDLGVELPAHEVPLFKRIDSQQKMARIPVIVATRWRQ